MSISPRPRLGFVLMTIVGMVAACSSAAASDPTAISGKFSVSAGRSLYVECHGSGSPTIVMDAGLGNTHATWSAVAPKVSPLTRTCTYDRANLGSSDAAPKPRSSVDVVADLRALLQSASIAPPYILVGHSFGGINMRLFAAAHPAEVAGLVLVDPTPTGFPDIECKLVDATLCAKLRSGFDPLNNPDGLDLAQSGVEIAQAGSLPMVPLIVLAATNHQQAAITDSGVQQQIEARWQQEETALAASVPGGTVTVVSSGHDIQTLYPEAVVTAITAVVGKARAKS